MVSMKITIIVLLSCLSLALAECPSNKRCRKRQESKLGKLTTNQVVLEAIYFGKSSNIYRFVVQRVWRKNHGNLQSQDRVNVTVSDETISDCYKNLRPSENYIIMVQPLDGSSYSAFEVPVSSRRKKHRKLVRDEMCEGRDDGVCALSISMYPNTPSAIFYKGSIRLIRCQVESISDVASVTWYKDGIDLDNEIYQNSGVFLIKDDPENSYVIINVASSVHNGVYMCEVRTTNGQAAQASTNLIVLGPDEESHFINCADPNYCLHDGICRQYIDLSVKPICQCKTGRDGKRCEFLVDDITPSSTEDQEDFDNMKDNIQQLTTGIIVVSVVLVLVLLVSVCYIARLRRHLTSSKNEYDVVTQSCTESSPHSDSNTSRYTNTGSDAASVRLSVIDGASVVDSRRSSMKSNIKAPTVFISNENEKFTEGVQLDIGEKKLLTNNGSRHSSTASNTFSKRGRLTANS